jgi:hypothetical protein
MLYELRVYYMHPGPLKNRFRDVTLTMFEKHGIKVCDFFKDVEGKEVIHYVRVFNDPKERDKAFASILFRNGSACQAETSKIESAASFPDCVSCSV